MTVKTIKQPGKFDRWRGLAYPVIRKKGGYFKSMTYWDLIWSSVMTILATRPGDIPGNREFGCSIPRSIFEPNDEMTRANLASSISQAITRWERRVSVKALKVTSYNENVYVYLTLALSRSRETLTKKLVMDSFNTYKLFELD